MLIGCLLPCAGGEWKPGDGERVPVGDLEGGDSWAGVEIHFVLRHCALLMNMCLGVVEWIPLYIYRLACVKYPMSSIISMIFSMDIHPVLHSSCVGAPPKPPKPADDERGKAPGGPAGD